MGALAIDPREQPARRPAQPRLLVVGDPATDSGRSAAPVPLTAAGRSGAAATAPLRTLGDVLGQAWSAVAAGRQAACPVCAGRLQPSAGAAGGRCADCGTTLE